ncbi:hypothetical protein LCGC14_3051370 [marine sediment metagenome]|uniref:Uncharacterized protein n=1 Tax=marine sediment metagenome TaxID=412755 RepID=A0A0F8X9S2_9ZZZZ
MGDCKLNGGNEEMKSGTRLGFRFLGLVTLTASNIWLGQGSSWGMGIEYSTASYLFLIISVVVMALMILDYVVISGNESKEGEMIKSGY